MGGQNLTHTEVVIDTQTLRNSRKLYISAPVQSALGIKRKDESIEFVISDGNVIIRVKRSFQRAIRIESKEPL